MTVVGGQFAAGHLGELTQVVPFDMVDAALAETDTVQQRVRDLPSRVVVYLLRAAALFAKCGYRQVWRHMVAGLDGLDVSMPSGGALAQARRRIGPAPLAFLFDLLPGPAAGPATRGVWWHGRLVCAVDGTSLCCPDTEANLAVHRKGGGSHGDATLGSPEVDSDRRTRLSPRGSSARSPSSSPTPPAVNATAATGHRDVREAARTRLPRLMARQGRARRPDHLVKTTSRK